MRSHQELLKEAVRLAKVNKDNGGQPFGAVLAIDAELVATGVNDIVASHDPTTHAEMEVVRAASRALGQPNLQGSIVYASGHPCPMCLAMLVIAGVDSVYYAFDTNDAEPYDLSSAAAYDKLRLSISPAPLPIKRLDTGVTASQLYGGES